MTPLAASRGCQHKHTLVHVHVPSSAVVVTVKTNVFKLPGHFHASCYPYKGARPCYYFQIMSLYPPTTSPCSGDSTASYMYVPLLKGPPLATSSEAAVARSKRHAVEPLNAMYPVIHHKLGCRNLINAVMAITKKFSRW